MKLKPGEKAPSFETTDIAGRRIRLSDYEGKKVLLCFFRYAGCPWCNLALFRLTKEYPKYEGLGLEVIAFIQSSRENIENNVTKRHHPAPQFPLIADQQRKVYQQYGVEDSLFAFAKSIRKIPQFIEAWFHHKFRQGKIDGSTTLVPAQFLIGPPGLQIHKASYGADYFDRIPMAEILEFARRGQKP